MTQTPRTQSDSQNPVPDSPVPDSKDRSDDDRQRQAALATSTKQIAKDAVRGGPKSVKKDKRPTGHGQKG